MMAEVRFIRQLSSKECGVAALAMMTDFILGSDISYQHIRHHCILSSKGLSIYHLCKAAEKMRLKTLPIKCSFETLIKNVQFPVIALIDRCHYVVITKMNTRNVEIINPTCGKQKYPVFLFKKIWCCDNNEGIVIVFFKNQTQ